MLMMRPARCFIIGLVAARARRNTAFRLVSMTASQSSSFIRMDSMSRVMPALLTSTCRPPSWATMASTAACTAAPSVTLSTMPRPPWAPSASVMPAAPASEFAVPMTRQPASARRSAIARPMPRLAPVTRAMPSFARDAESVMDHAPRRARASASEAGSNTQAAWSSASMRLAMPVSTLPGPASIRWFTPRAFRACTTSTHRTGPKAWR
mmetsp:Transcript_37653/g.92539  ORF Transcript_37653/g.92539 Transcript_37653/m.92539 type:complete len:209 (-) Transcript_37653:382-1008(-)